jgi:SPP1 family predicted phage head-tail adaptor
MRAGELTKKVTIWAQQPAVIHGVPKPTWYELATVWAQVSPISGREFLAMDKKNADVTTRIRIRFIAGIKSSFRVYDGLRQFNIEYVIDVDEKHDELELMCKEIVE